MDDLPPKRYTELWASGSLTIKQKQRKLANDVTLQDEQTFTGGSKSSLDTHVIGPSE